MMETETRATIGVALSGQNTTGETRGTSAEELENIVGALFERFDVFRYMPRPWHCVHVITNTYFR